MPDPIDPTMETGERRCTGCGATWDHLDPVPLVGLTAGEATALLRAADRDPYPAAMHNRVLIRFLLHLGARVSEAIGANMGRR